MRPFRTKWGLVAAVALPLLAACTIIVVLNWSDEKKTQMEPEITPEQARAALLKLGSLRVITGGEEDPIALDLKSGAIAWTDGSNVTIGRFFSCNLKEKTWHMAVDNGRTGRMHFKAGANGKFEFQSDGTWRAMGGLRYIT
jgi:hypothetical protein